MEKEENQNSPSSGQNQNKETGKHEENLAEKNKCNTIFVLLS